MPSTRVISEIYRRVREAGRHSSESIRHVLLVDEDNILIDVVDFLDLLQREENTRKSLFLAWLCRINARRLTCKPWPPCNWCRFKCGTCGTATSR